MNENYVNVEEKCFAYEESVVRNEVPHTHTAVSAAIWHCPTQTTTFATPTAAAVCGQHSRLWKSQGQGPASGGKWMLLLLVKYQY